MTNIDWTKPIRVKTYGQWTSGIPELFYCGKDKKGRAVVQATRGKGTHDFYVFNDDGTAREFYVAWELENIPEPPKEWWINVWMFNGRVGCSRKPWPSEKGALYGAEIIRSNIPKAQIIRTIKLSEEVKDHEKPTLCTCGSPGCICRFRMYGDSSHNY